MFARASTRLVRQISRAGTRGYADNAMSFTFASQSEVFYSEATNVKQIDVPSFSGNFGILPSHVATLAVLKPGIVTVIEDAGPQKYFVSSGMITINDDSTVQILAEEACRIDQLDLSAARDALSKANQSVNTAKSEVDKATAMIEVEVAEQLVKAVESG